MEEQARTQAVTRTAFLAGGAALWATAIFGRIFFVQVARHRHFAALANQQQFEIVDVPGPRGSIFDRNGEVFAMSEPVDSVYVNPMLLPDLSVAARVIAPVLHLNPDQLYARLKASHDDRKRRGFFWVKRKLTPEEKANIESLVRLPWIKLRQDTIRRYPQQTVAAHVVGSVDFDEKGNAGLELSREKELRGEAGAAQLLTDVHKRGIASELLDQPKLGTDLVLTIDERIQSAAEQDLRAAIQSSNAKTGTVVVMNPKNGEILAMASYPVFDPNKTPAPGEPHSLRLNRAVEAPFEPGSVFKVITLSTALETTNLHPESILPCGTINMYKRIIHEAHGTYGPLSMAEVLARSSNVGAIQIGMKIGKDKLYEYVRRFGFGQKTGVNLPYESSGRLRKLREWKPGSMLSIPMGHEISVTAVQLARACSVIANGGLLVQPKLILQRKRAGQVLEEAASPAPVRIVKPETAFTMRGMMEGVVLHGTGTKARLSGYSCAGKTGSAQIYDYATGHYTKYYNASFMGFAPVTNPAIVVVVTLNGTTGIAGYGGTASGPVFRTVSQEALRVLDVPKDIPERDDLEPDVDGPDRTVYENDTAIADLSDPPPLEESEENPAEPEKPVQAGVTGPRVPNFNGMTMRAVLEEASAMGLPVSLDGRGVARMQIPRPGSILPPGSRIRVVFAR
jgi:cell division protein FtsI (penicillin-binding protein 3)